MDYNHEFMHMSFSTLFSHIVCSHPFTHVMILQTMHHLILYTMSLLIVYFNSPSFIHFILFPSLSFYFPHLLTDYIHESIIILISTFYFVFLTNKYKCMSGSMDCIFLGSPLNFIKSPPKET